jgi:hypothetical protein
MNLTGSAFKISGIERDCYRIFCNEQITGTEATFIRDEIAGLIKSDFERIYIDAKNVKEINLSGINEIIHSHFITSLSNTKIVFLYRQNSAVEKWVQTTGVNKFIETAMVPEN